LYKVLHLESTDVCQAECPLCSRSTNPAFTDSHSHLSIEQIQAKFGTDIIKSLDKMFMCGNYGDPAAGRNTLEIYRYFRSINHNITLGMNTNGALQSVEWWKQLAKIFMLPADYVVFSIDGLEDTNHIYRRNVIWNKLIDNCTSYINAGGNAHWDMLVYKHNQHQVDECMELAKTLGFKWFRAKVSKRAFIDGLEFPVGYESPRIEQGNINCMALQESSVYISATGDVHPCCWLGNDLNNTLKMADVQATWNTDTPHPTCKRTCSTMQNSFKNQWQREVELC